MLQVLARSRYVAVPIHRQKNADHPPRCWNCVDKSLLHQGDRQIPIDLLRTSVKGPTLTFGRLQDDLTVCHRNDSQRHLPVGDRLALHQSLPTLIHRLPEPLHQEMQRLRLAQHDRVRCSFAPCEQLQQGLRGRDVAARQSHEK